MIVVTYVFCPNNDYPSCSLLMAAQSYDILEGRLQFSREVHYYSYVPRLEIAELAYGNLFVFQGRTISLS